MRDEIVKLVFPVLTTGLQRKQELLGGMPLVLDEVQKELAGLLQATSQAEAYISPGRFKGFLGIQYPLACWLDEIFISDDCPWQRAWTERSLEVELFDTRDRAWSFYQQAGIARKLAVPDALEVYYLCVVLGFRGIASDPQAARDFPDAPQDGNVQGWCDDIKEQLDKAQTADPLNIIEKQPTTNVPELHGADRVQTFTIVLVVCLYLLAPVFGVLIALLPDLFPRLFKQ